MKLQTTRLVYWKTEHTVEDNEDACHADPDTGLFAVADGVGETSFSHQWAPVLVERFVRDPLTSTDPFEVEHWVRAAQREAKPRITSPETLSGVAQTKARLGASATLLGLSVVSLGDYGAGPPYSYKVTAVGDSNFFHWRPITGNAQPGDGPYELVRCFPFDSSDQFGTLPNSINSRNFDRYNTTPLVFDATADPRYTLRDGDVLLLATDAVAQWVLGLVEMGHNPVADLLNETEETWPRLIEHLREQRWIVNDDSTLLVIQVSGVNEEPALKAVDYPGLRRARTAEVQALIAEAALGRARDTELALAYGDGSQLEPVIKYSSFAQQSALWREYADAFKAVSDGVQVTLRHPDRISELSATWARHREQLVRLAWTNELITTLRTLGVEPLEQSAPQMTSERPPITDKEATAQAGGAAAEALGQQRAAVTQPGSPAAEAEAATQPPDEPAPIARILPDEATPAATAVPTPSASGPRNLPSANDLVVQPQIPSPPQSAVRSHQAAPNFQEPPEATGSSPRQHDLASGPTGSTATSYGVGQQAEGPSTLPGQVASVQRPSPSSFSRWQVLILIGVVGLVLGLGIYVVVAVPTTPAPSPSPTAALPASQDVKATPQAAVNDPPGSESPKNATFPLANGSE